MLIGRFKILNVLPLILIGILMGGEKFATVKEFLSKIDFPSFTPIFSLLGVNKKTMDFLCSKDFENLLSSSGNITDLLPLLGSLFSKKPETEKTEDGESDGEKTHSDYFTAIKNVAPTDVEETLFSYTSQE